MSKVLVIEDYEDNATLFERVLKSRGHTVFSAPDGESGLKMAMEHRPDLILLDLGLPDIDGQTVASQIRRTAEVAHVPILVVTAWPADTARTMIEVYGCNGYLRKPIEIAQLIASVDSLLADSAC